MLRLSGFELYSRWVPLKICLPPTEITQERIADKYGESKASD